MIITYACFPASVPVVRARTRPDWPASTSPTGRSHLAILFAYVWLAASMPVAWLAQLPSHGGGVGY